MLTLDTQKLCALFDAYGIDAFTATQMIDDLVSNPEDFLDTHVATPVVVDADEFGFYFDHYHKPQRWSHRISKFAEDQFSLWALRQKRYIGDDGKIYWVTVR